MKTLLSILLTGLGVLLSPLSLMALPLSPGDRINVSIPNEKYFAGVYEVNQAGNIEVPYVGPLSVVGLEPTHVATILREIFIQEGYFPPNNLPLSVQVVLWAPVQVTISGDVFLPGRFSVNDSALDEIEKSTFSKDQQIYGEFAPNRFLSNALRAAGGVTPTSDIKHIRLIRGTEVYEVDFSGIFTGKPVRDLPLIAGDQIIVPVADRYQPELVRPSAITPPGIKVVVSNLTTPALSNATSSISNREEGIDFTYGSRFSHAVFAMNCVGGIKATNASRRAVLVRADRKTGETVAFERSIEDIIRNSKSDRDNPFLMRSDSVACYDSKVTNVRDIFDSLGDVFSPIRIIKDIFF